MSKIKTQIFTAICVEVDSDTQILSEKGNVDLVKFYNHLSVQSITWACCSTKLVGMLR
jgi:hypothetical protein